MPQVNLCTRITTLLMHSSGSVEASQTISEAIKEVAKFAMPIIEHEYLVKVEGIETLKNSLKSATFCTEGNEAFVRKQFLKSLLSYDDSISHAPLNSPELALAYANRSAVLQKMGKLMDCLADIQRAMDCGYPDNIKYVLLLRKAQCLRDLGQSKQAQLAFDLALNALKMSELSAERREWDKSVIVEDKNKKSCKVLEFCNVVGGTEVPSLSYGPSEEVPCASSALQVGYDDTYGRHFVATRDISIGDVLLVEDPQCLNMPDGNTEMPVELHHCCSHCQKLSFTLLPCPTCIWAMFCSEKCMTEAAEQYHNIECPVICKLFLLDGELTHTGVIRCIAKIGLQNVNKYFNLTDKILETNVDKRTRGFNSDGKYDSGDLLTVLNLEHNFSKFNLTLKLHFCISALEMTKCFYPNSHFQFLDLTVLLCHLISSFLSNAVCINYPIFVCNNPKISHMAIGGAIYPAASLLSPSCNANLAPVFHGNKLVLFALYPIAKGQQATLSCGQHWLTTDKTTRQIELDNAYKFKCECEACYYNWPTFNNLKPLSISDLLQSPQTCPIINKIAMLRGTYEKLASTIQPLLLNRKSLDQFCEKKLKLVSEVVTILYNNNMISNIDFAILLKQLNCIFSVYGTAITKNN